MKNFRKVLALVLVVAMMFSFTAMSSAAYEDASDISYKEAVDVLTAVGILNGYEVAEDEYEFHPTAEIDRDEMAKMIAVLANAGDDVSELYAVGTKFADVPKTHWAASYVAYCANEGIVDGRSASTFDPDASVTALETAKMILVVLGFDGKEQGYTGANWKTNVLTDAKLMGLFNAFPAKYNYDSNITRELAAQMMLNALEAPCVAGILSDGIVKVTNGLIYGGLKIDLGSEDLIKLSAYATLKDAMATGNWCLYGNVVISNDLLGYRLFGLERNVTTANDCMMRPATSWSWTVKGKDVVIGTYAADAIWESNNTSWTAVKKVTDTYAQEGKNAYTVKFYSNGDEKDLAWAKTDLGGKGTEVQIFVVGKEVRVVEVNTYIGVLTAVNTNKKTVTVTDLETEETYNAKNVFGLTKDDVDAVVLYQICEGGKDNTCSATHTGTEELHDVEIVAPVTAKITKAHAAKGDKTTAYFVAEEKYEYEDNYVLDYVIGEMGDEGEDLLDVKDTVKIYTDKNGYVMYIKSAASTSYKYAVVDFGSAKRVEEYDYKVSATETATKYSYTVQMVEFEEDPAVGEAIAATEAMWNRVDKSSKKSDTLVKYYVDANGKVTVDNTVDTKRAYEADIELAKPTKATSIVVTEAGYYMTKETQILLRVLNPMTGKHEYKYFDGIDELDAKYMVDNLGYYYSGDYVTYAYGEATYVKTSALAYILDYAGSTKYLTDGNQVVGYNLYEALVDGEEAIVAYSGKDDTLAAGDYNKVYQANYICIGLTTDDELPVYYTATALGDNAAVDAGTLKLDEGKGLLIYETAEGKKALNVDDEAEFMMVFVGGKWSNMEYNKYTLDEIETFFDEFGWNQLYIWTVDSDNDGLIDFGYVNVNANEMD